jgi:hypothetical protein
MKMREVDDLNMHVFNLKEENLLEDKPISDDKLPSRKLY